MRFWNMATVMALKPGTGAPSRSLLRPTTTTVPALRMAPKACPMCSFLTTPMLTIAESSGTSPRRRSTRNGTAMAPRSRPGRASSTWPRSWTWPPGGVLGFALGEHHDAALTYGALAMAVAVRGGQVPGVIMHTDRGRIHRGRLPRGLPAPGRLPVDGQTRVRAGQRGHRILALDPGVRAPLGGAVRHQGSSPGQGPRLDPRVQPHTPALGLPDDVPRSTTSGHWRPGRQPEMPPLLRHPVCPGSHGSYHEARTSTISQIKVSTL